MRLEQVLFMYESAAKISSSVRLPYKQACCWGMISQSSFQRHIRLLKRGTSHGGAKCVLFHHVVAQADNHLHVYAAS